MKPGEFARRRRAAIAMTASEPTIRVAVPSDAEAVSSCVEAAYRRYVARIGKPPAPMLENYAASIRNATVHVLSIGGLIVGVVVLRLGADREFARKTEDGYRRVYMRKSLVY